MLENVVNMFTRRQPGRDATLAVARIMSRYDMTRLSYGEGLHEDRRSRDERNVATGVWLFPCGPHADAGSLRIAAGVPAVTHDIRPSGFGILTPVKIEEQHFVVAFPDENAWKFFSAEVCHNTPRPGHWYQLGLKIDRVVELDQSRRAEFRQHITTVTR